MPFKTVNPATGELVRSFEEISDRDLELVLGTAHKAYETDWRLRPVAERAGIVSRAAAILREKTEEYAGYLTLEMGKRIAESRSEVGVAAAILEYYAKKAESYLKPRLLPESPGAEVHTNPIGVLLGIEPWNYPYYQIARETLAPIMRERGLAWEFHIDETPRDYWSIEGFRPPPTGSEAEKRWLRENRPSAYVADAAAPGGNPVRSR